MEEKEIHQADNETSETMFDINSDESMPGTSHLSDPIAEDLEADKLRADIAEQKDKYLRLFSDFDNFKRRTAKERIELMQTAGKEIIVSLLDVLDDSDPAEKQLQETDDVAQIKEGIQLVFNKLRSTLQSRGLKVMDSMHTDFDVEKHEAITEIPSPSDDLKGKVLAEVTKGYYLNDKIIRHAKVVVGN